MAVKQWLNYRGLFDMLETPEERVKLLKAGIIGKKIEEIYILANDFKILNQTILFEK